jgi:hypothetical protein
VRLSNILSYFPAFFAGAVAGLPALDTKPLQVLSLVCLLSTASEWPTLSWRGCMPQNLSVVS